MSRPTSVAVIAAWLCFGGAAIAHHSVGINFDATKAFNLTACSRKLTSGIRIPRSRCR